MKIGVCSLGCDKNRIDTENMLSFMLGAGYEITADPSDAEIIVVNTCGFIESAKQESIETILEMAEFKKNKCKYLIVSGCLTQRYMDEMKDGFDEVDAFIGTGSYQHLPAIMTRLLSGEKHIVEINDKDDRHFSRERVLTTPYHYAYLKIAEGCDNKCTYCAIPKIRGIYTSRPILEIVQETKELISKYHTSEIILVAQDVSCYGKDLYGKVKLIELLEELSKLDIKWIRLLYLYPENITDELLAYIAGNDKICKYLDIPCQHASDKILKLMNRRITKSKIEKLLERIRMAGDFIIRTTFIVGFPQESEQEFEELKKFVKDSKFDRCGFFAYSCEDGTPASLIKGQLDESVKLARQEELYKIQKDIMKHSMKKNLGKIVSVIYEGIDYHKQMFFGRASYDAPEIDTRVLFTSSKPLDIGQIYKMKINAVHGIDTIGEIVE